MDPGAEREPGIGFEPWAKVAFGLTGAVVVLFVYLGSRPGGPVPVKVYTYGPLTLGALAALQLGYGIVRSFVSRPVLQRGRLGALASLSASLWICSFPFAYPSSHEGHPSTTAFRLPFDGEWRVRWGGDRREQNVLVLNPARRFGFVFEPPDGPAPVVLAPARGIVVRVGDESGDGGQELGTRLVLEVGPDEFLVLEGLVRGSVEPAPGAAVAAGAPLARVVGGDALTVFLQDSPRVGRGEGIPLLFRDFVADERPLERGTPLRGQLVSPGGALSR